jgi:hypothetical protein
MASASGQLQQIEAKRQQSGGICGVFATVAGKVVGITGV